MSYAGATGSASASSVGEASTSSSDGLRASSAGCTPAFQPAGLSSFAVARLRSNSSDSVRWLTSAGSQLSSRSVRVSDSPPPARTSPSVTPPSSVPLSVATGGSGVTSEPPVVMLRAAPSAHSGTAREMVSACKMLSLVLGHVDVDDRVVDARQPEARLQHAVPAALLIGGRRDAARDRGRNGTRRRDGHVAALAGAVGAVGPIGHVHLLRRHRHV
mmetsp:Transcript_42372/g.117251  ORF Transcript_42372/g.117251 Transcript_42372/m.117251 type:complete len:216 (+) Transcript_42372:222-869(+)